jgi:hypothetical protein
LAGPKRWNERLQQDLIDGSLRNIDSANAVGSGVNLPEIIGMIRALD